MLRYLLLLLLSLSLSTCIIMVALSQNYMLQDHLRMSRYMTVVDGWIPTGATAVKDANYVSASWMQWRSADYCINAQRTERLLSTKGIFLFYSLFCSSMIHSMLKTQSPVPRIFPTIDSWYVIPTWLFHGLHRLFFQISDARQFSALFISLILLVLISCDRLRWLPSSFWVHV